MLDLPTAHAIGAQRHLQVDDQGIEVGACAWYRCLMEYRPSNMSMVVHGIKQLTHTTPHVFGFKSKFFGLQQRCEKSKELFAAWLLRQRLPVPATRRSLALGQPFEPRGNALCALLADRFRLDRQPLECNR
ncbi:hypothetical protein D3C73_1368710 [compost metagenome]